MVPICLSGVLKYAKAYDFQLISWLLYYVMATGKGKSGVKEVKKMLKKSNPLNGLLEHRNIHCCSIGLDLLPGTEVSLLSNKVNFASVSIIVASVCTTS